MADAAEAKRCVDFVVDKEWKLLLLPKKGDLFAFFFYL